MVPLRRGRDRQRVVATNGTMKRILSGTVAVVVVAVAAAWIARSQQGANGTTSVLQASGPLIARGYTEAPAGTVMIASVISSMDEFFVR